MGHTADDSAAVAFAGAVVSSASAEDSMAIYHALFRYSILREVRVVVDGPYLTYFVGFDDDSVDMNHSSQMIW